MTKINAASCTNTKPNTSLGSIPTNVFVKLLAMVTAGFAKNVDDVNQYPAVTVMPTSIAILSFAYFKPKRITKSKTSVEINSLNNIPAPFLGLVEA